MTSPPKSKTLAIAPKFTAILSICGSLGIVLKVLTSPTRRKQTMHRIVMGMSICDIFASIWYFTSTWAIPANTLSWFGDGETETIFWAAGDEEGISCSVAGFFNQFAVATPLYNLTLSFYYLLVVNFNWKDSRAKKWEWLFHAIPIGYAILTSTFAAAADMYGHVEWTCWILPTPLFNDAEELTPIQSQFKMIQWLFLFGVVWICILLVSINFIVLYRKMKSIEQRLRRYSFASISGGLDLSSKGFSALSESGAEASSMQITTHSEHSGDKSEGDDGSSKESGNAGEPEHKPDLEYGTDNRVSDEEGAGSPDNDDADENVDQLKESEIGDKETSQLPDDAVVQLREAEDSGNRKKRTTWLPSTFKRNSVTKYSEKKEQACRRKKEMKEARKDMKSRKIAIQGLMYICAFFVTWLFPTISRITELVAGKNFFAIQFLDTFLIPLQGYFNFFIYIRPQFMTYRKRHIDDGFWKSLRTVIFKNED